MKRSYFFLRPVTRIDTPSRAFSLVELIVSIAIFGIMTALVVAKYGTFNSSTLLTNAAYDVALAIRTAQTYGVSVKSDGTSNFTKEYVVDFNVRNTVPPNEYCAPDTSHFTLWINNAAGDIRPVPFCRDLVKVNDYTLLRGAKVSSICAGTDANNCTNFGRLVIRFLRPDPDARFGTIAMHDPTEGGSQNFARVTIQDPDGSKRNISIYKNGQVSVDQ